MPDIDQYTAQIVPDTKTTISNQYFDLNQPFAFPRYGNECTPYINGRDYMKAVADAIRNAKSFIMITGWQLDYDVELDHRGDPKHPGRLSELLADALARGVHVRVMLYDSYEGKLDTHDDVTQDKLGGLSSGKGSIKVMLQNPNTGRAGGASQLGKYATGDAMDTNAFFSHHQKSVIIDGEKAFLGGIDLAYGRWDTNAFDVVIDPSLHVLNDANNSQILPYRKPTADELALSKEKDGRPGFAPTYTTNGNDNGYLFDPNNQPRQPWQDIALQVKGPAAYDVFVNFVLRWGSFAGSGTNGFDANMDAGWFEKAKGHVHLTDPLAKGNGTASVQICRSTSSKQLSDELVLWDNKHKYVNDDWKTPKLERRKIVQTARAAWVGNHQTSIRDAMVNCIRAAQAFIYIENQFFISDCGVDQNGTKSPASNPIVAELANAIGQAIHAERAFHVWLVLPEHPEGKMEEEATSSQAWWAQQCVKRGKNSLINRINATIVSKNKKKWSIEQPKTNDGVLTQLASHGMSEEWKKYLTVLNVRNYGKTSGDKVTGPRVVSEMIYVHSKLTIVDDAVAIIGSANINDRSLNGNGDTEIAAVVVDDSQASLVDVGGGVKCITRQFAKDLREKLWQKHLGMLVDQATTGVQKQGAASGINVDKPLDPATISGIQKLAEKNRATYNEVFVHTARDSYGTLTEGRIKGYTRTYTDKTGKSRSEFSAMLTPKLQATYMDAKGNHKTTEALTKLNADVKGFWVSMPLDWGSKEASTPKAPQNSPAIIAKVESSTDKNRVGVA
jgi:phospholipase D1/2